MSARARGAPRAFRGARATVRPRARGRTHLAPGRDGAPLPPARAATLGRTGALLHLRADRW
eukprot:9644339-Alexandrium_andersonii.AAC.1